MFTENCQIWNFFATGSVYISIKRMRKASTFFENDIILEPEGDWDDLWAKFYFYRQLVTKYLSKSKTIKEPWKRPENFDT